MKKLLHIGCLFIVVMGVAAMAMADTFTTSSCSVDFAVNDGGSFYVKSSQILPGASSPPGVDASSSISGFNFHLTAAGAGYSDSGIVLYFNGGFNLGDLLGMSVGGAGGPIAINLWLDTGGDGQFFAFDGNGMLTGLNSDSYGSHSGTSLDANSTIYMMGGNGAGQTYTLAQLQSGVVAGIDGTTGASLWIGITDSGSGAADISGVAVSAAGESAALQTGGDRLVEMQYTDGGWGWPLNAPPTYANIHGPIAMGLAKAYSHTGSAGQHDALIDAGTFLLAKTNTFSPPDGYLAAELDGIFGGNTYRNHVNTYYYNQLAAGTYNRNGLGTLYDTAGYINLIRTDRASQGIPNLAAWDIGMGLVAAASCGASTSEWISGVKAEINELEGDGLNSDYDVIGLAGAVYGLAFVNENFDPTAGEHAAASNLGDLATILASYQINNGGFAGNKNNVAPGNEAIQETGYAILALNEVNRSTYLSNLQGASDYLVSVQMATGGWGGESGGDPDAENNEVTGEALWGISTVYCVADTDSDGDGIPDCHDLCPDDPLKINPGICGCGVADTDSDSDGTADCNDLCPNDPLKTAPGQCGCGVPDTDSDGDGVANCNDSCPNDPLKIVPGQCGCGVADTDSDSDGVADCIDGCPADPLKSNPGQCGCGNPDTDTDIDGVADCIDNCLSVANPGQEDTDLDGIGDACDSCTGSCPVRTDTPVYFPTIQSAYDNAIDGNSIEIRDLDFIESLVFDRTISVTVKGGYDEGFTGNPSYSTIHGSMKVTNGTVVVERIIIQ